MYTYNKKIYRTQEEFICRVNNVFIHVIFKKQNSILKENRKTKKKKIISIIIINNIIDNNKNDSDL